MLLAACDGTSRQELQSLGSRLSGETVDFTEIDSYARRAKTVYLSEAEIRAAYPLTVRIASPGTTELRYMLERDDRAHRQYVTIRGTANRANLSEDMQVEVRKDARIGIPVHAGFDADARAVYGDLQAELRKDYRTYISGHSLGGAVAAVVALYAIEDGHRVAEIVTFGQPRFTTAKGVAKAGALPLTRVVDENDIVPMLPPATAFDPVDGPYEHVGPEVILLEGQHYVYLPNHDANRLTVGEFWRETAIANLADHRMDAYLKRIAAKLSGAVEVTYTDRERYVARRPSHPSDR